MGTMGGAATSSHLLTWDPELAQALHCWGAWEPRLRTGDSSPLKLCLSFLGLPPLVPPLLGDLSHIYPGVFSNTFSPSLATLQ